VRIVEATKEHARFLAWVSLAAARSHLPRGFWDFFIGPDERECLRYLTALAATEKPHPFHHSVFLVAEVDGRPASAMCGFFEEETGFALLGGVMPEVDRALGRPPEAAQEGIARLGPFMSVTPEHPPRAWIVENVATLPEFRRRGLVDRLMGAMLERAASRGARLADLSVFIGNDPAQRAYEKAGFEAVSEKRNAEIERTWGTPGLRPL
jgi:ribosomal protein S18 acetylase RimI-like enzyme